MRKPKYYGTVVRTKEPCFCQGYVKGPVWFWTPRVTPPMTGMAAHTKCFRRLWAGAY